MAAACPECYETTCPKAADRTLACCNWHANALASRTTEGDYEAGLRNTLPQETRALDGVHIDVLSTCMC